MAGRKLLGATPVVLLPKVLNFMFHSKAQGTLVLPYWPSAPFWPLLVRTFWGFVVDYRFFAGALALRLGRNTKSLLGSPTWSGYIIAVRLGFSYGSPESIFVIRYMHLVFLERWIFSGYLLPLFLPDGRVYYPVFGRAFFRPLPDGYVGLSFCCRMAVTILFVGLFVFAS